MARTIDLSGQVALVTGSTSGIGKATARKFLEAGAAVVINGRDEQRGRAALDELLRATGAGEDRCVFQPGDVTDQEQARGLVQAALERFGRIDMLINNAGTAGNIQPFARLDPSQWFESFEIKFGASCI